MRNLSLPYAFGIMILVALVMFPIQAVANPTVRSGKTYYSLKPTDSIKTLLEHPAFSGFGRHLLPRSSDASNSDLPLSRISSLLPYHSHVNISVVLAALNHMVDKAKEGETLFYHFYTESQRQQEPEKNDTGLFFFRGNPGAPFAVICPGGGFSYVGSVHEGFPYALELSKKGYNAFVLKYRVGQGGTAATTDLAAALSFIVKNADSLAVNPDGYSLWGSSAGARMAASLASYGTASFGGSQINAPSIVVMAYTGHTDFTPNDPPTFVTVSENDPIINVAAVERRIRTMRNAGIEVAYQKYENVGHGFGLGTGTEAEGWIDLAIQFWATHIGQ